MRDPASATGSTSGRSVPAGPPADPVLPDGFGFALGPVTRVCDDGRTLVAGATVLRLSAAAAEVVARVPVLAGDGDSARRLARLLLDRDVAVPWWRDPAGIDDAVTDVTVVVPIQDRSASLARLLASLPTGVPVIVVDDGSADPEALRAVCQEFGARLLAHRVNRGPAAARNTGLAQVRTPYVAFCDSDVLPEPGWLATLRRHLDDPRVALVAPRVAGAEPRPGDGWLDRYEQARSALDLGEEAAAVRVHGRVSYLPSACVVGRVAALADGFDEQMRSGEDVDLVWRLLEAGWLVRYQPDAQVRHDHRTELGPWLARKAFYGTSAAPLAQRHRDSVAPMVITGWSAVFTTALLAQRRWSIPVAAGAAGVTAVISARRLSSPHPWRLAGVLTLEGAVASAWQAGSALTRHYWPVAAVACLFSRRARRAVAVAAVADGLADWRRVRPRLDPVRYLAARRLDDLGYGWGLWQGALRSRSAAALRPQVKRRRR